MAWDSMYPRYLGMTWRPTKCSLMRWSSWPSAVASITGAQSDMSTDGLPLAARYRNRRSGCNVLSMSPGPDLMPSGWVRCMIVAGPPGANPRTSSALSMTMAVSSWSSPPGRPVPWAVEPTSTRRMVASGSVGFPFPYLDLGANAHRTGEVGHGAPGTGWGRTALINSWCIGHGELEGGSQMHEPSTASRPEQVVTIWSNRKRRSISEGVQGVPKGCQRVQQRFAGRCLMRLHRCSRSEASTVCRCGRSPRPRTSMRP